METAPNLKKPSKIFNFEINKTQIIGILIALVIVVLDFIFIFNNEPLFYFILGLSFIISGLPFFLFLVLEANKTIEKETMFLEFSRNLVDNVKTGTPISKAIFNIKSKDYGALNPYVQKLANQISLGIPLQTAFENFSRDAGSSTISRAISIISESEKAGGDIQEVLDAVIKSVSQIERLKKERRAAIYSLVVQGYIIFMIFIVIVVVLEFKILPIVSGLGESVIDSSTDVSGEIGQIFGTSGKVASLEELSRPFFWFLVVQGFFTGLVVGKLSEGKIRPGLKHSFVLMVLAILVDTGSKIFLT